EAGNDEDPGTDDDQHGGEPGRRVRHRDAERDQRAAGRKPTTNATAPIDAAPTTPSPQRSLMMLLERLIASFGRRPSSVMRGTTKNVATVHAKFARPPTIADRI